MDELINKVAATASITEDQARSAVNTVIEFAKDRLPATIAG
jgi:nucleoid DNA-binding protein